MSNIIINPYQVESAAPADFQLQSIDFDGSTEYLANTTPATLNVSNTLSLFAWYRYDTIVGANRRITDTLHTGTNVDGISLFSTTSGAVGFRLVASDSSGIFKDYTSAGTVSAGAKSFVGLTWDGGTDTFKVYIDGVDVTAAATKGTDTAGKAMADTIRTMGIGARSDGAAPLDGNVSSVMLYDTDLSAAEVTAMWDSGNGYKRDYRIDYGNYASQANMQHYWTPGRLVSTNLANDLGVGTAMDLETNSVNISDADREAF